MPKKVKTVAAPAIRVACLLLAENNRVRSDPVDFRSLSPEPVNRPIDPRLDDAVGYPSPNVNVEMDQ